MDETPAQQTLRLRVLQDRWLALPSVADRRQREGDGARIHGPASPTFAEVYWHPQPEWVDWFASEVARLDRPATT